MKFKNIVLDARLCGRALIIQSSFPSTQGIAQCYHLVKIVLFVGWK